MKTMTAKEFYNKPAARHKWKPGQIVLVTTAGQPDLEVRKIGSKQNMARGCVKDIPLSGGVSAALGEDGWQFEGSKRKAQPGSPVLDYDYEDSVMLRFGAVIQNEKV